MITDQIPPLPLPPELRHICLEDEIVAYAHDVARAYAEQQTAHLWHAFRAEQARNLALEARVELLEAARDAMSARIDGSPAH